MNSSRARVGALIATIAVATIGLMIWVWGGRAKLDPSQINTVLVLPIDDGTEFREFEDSCDAVADTLVTSLGSAKNLHTIATTTTFVYKTRVPELAHIRERTGADAVMDGRLEKAGDRIKMNLRLRRISDGKEVWAFGRNVDPKNLLPAADSAARELGDALKRPVRSKPLPPMKDASAVNFFADARRRLRSDDANDLVRAVVNLNKAKALSPDFTPASASLAEVYGWATMLEIATENQAREKSANAVMEARAANPESPEANFAEGAIALYLDWNWAEAEAKLTKAVEVRPSYVPGWLALGHLYEATGRLPQALEAMQRAHTLDPLGKTTNMDFAFTLIFNGRHDEALQLMDRYAEIDPNVNTATIVRALALYGKGDYAGARDTMRSMLHLGGWKVPVYALLGPAEARSGNLQEARKIMTELDAMTKDGEMDGVILAGVRLALGDEAKAFEDLRRAVKRRSSTMQSIYGSPLFEKYRKDPRMLEVLAAMKSGK